VIDATSRVPPASISTFAVASPKVILVTRPLILLRALSLMCPLWQVRQNPPGVTISVT
jgi:hypothetical protein